MNARLLGWLGVAAGVVALDQLTKWLVLLNLPAGEIITLTSFFKLVHVYNEGAAFSFLAGHSGWQRWFFVGLALLVCGWLLHMLRQHQHETALPIAFTFIMGGAIGNVIDRLYHGAVVDFLYFHYQQYGWPAFNLADSAICVGVAIMLWSQFRPHPQPAREDFK